MATQTSPTTGQRYGVGHLVDVLLGKDNEKVRSFGHEKLSVFGVGKAMAEVEWRSLFRELVARGLVDIDKGARAELDQRQPSTSLWRHRKAAMGLVGGRCTKTGTVQAVDDVSLYLNQGETLGEVQTFLAAEHLSLGNVLLDEASAASTTLDVRAFPSTLFFDAQGRLRELHLGELTQAGLEHKLRRLR